MILFLNNYIFAASFFKTKKVKPKEKKILICAEKLFAEKGFEATSIREIAKDAATNVSMISYYFGSKEKLFEAIFEFRRQESLSFAILTAEKTNLNAWEKCEIILEQFVKRIKNNKAYHIILQREQINLKNHNVTKQIEETRIQFLNTFSKIIEEGRKEKIFKKNPSVVLIQTMLLGTLFSSINSLDFYQSYFKEKKDFEKEYFQELHLYLTDILKHLLGYE